MTDADIREAQLARYDTSGDLQGMEFETLPSELSTLVARRANLSHAQLSRALAVRTDFTDAILDNSNLRKADLRNCVLVGASLDGTDLSQANLSSCTMTGAVMTGTKVQGARFQDADIRGAMLDDAVANAPELFDAKRAEGRDVSEEIGTILREHATWVQTNSRSGTRANLSDSRLNGFKRPGAVLTASVMERVALRGANLRGAELAMGALAFADLREADLSNADLRGVDLSRTLADDANLKGARIGPVENVAGSGQTWLSNLERAKLRRADLSGADLRKVSAVGADLREADLRGADLRGADLRDADLRDALLEGAELTDVALEGANRDTAA